MNLLQGSSQTKTDLYVSGNPGKLIEVSQDGQGVRMGKANFGVGGKQVCLEDTSEVSAGEYVLVHVGFALGKVDKEELAELGSPASLSCAEEDSYEIPR
jgi:hydrogenase expression/formation protein HypC